MMPLSKWSLHRTYIGLLGLVFLIAVAVMGASLILGGSPALIIGDGKGYYTWTRSLILDRDIDFYNDYHIIYPPDPLPDVMDRRTYKGYLPNKYSIGLALIETPGFLLGHLIAKVTGVEPNGVTTPYQVCVAFSIILLLLGSFYLLYRALRNFGIASKTTFLFCGMALLGTNLIHYIAKEPGMVHPSNVALVNILIFLASLNFTSFRRSFLYRLLVGVLVGWLLINRTTNVALLPFLAFLFLRRETLSWKVLIPYVLGIIPMLALQQAAYVSLWGWFTVNSYKGEGFTGGLRGVIGTLFSNQHGLFIYHPWYLILLGFNIFGVWRNKPADRLWNLAVLTSFFALWMINGNWWGWSFGDSFGNRGFLEILVPLTTGAAITFDAHFASWSLTWKRGFLILLGLLIFLNFFTWVGYLFKKYPHSGDHSVAEVYLWPFK